jgi:hypothetical protein
MNAIAMLERCATHQRGLPLPTPGPLCRFCNLAAATEIFNGEPACYVCAGNLQVERLMQRNAVTR